MSWQNWEVSTEGTILIVQDSRGRSAYLRGDVGTVEHPSLFLVSKSDI